MTAETKMTASDTPPPLTWGAIVRLGLAQAALGAMVVITTSLLNRVMLVELALPATLAGLFLAVNYGAQTLRPRWGHGLDRGGRVRVWILGGLAVLGAGATLAAAGVAATPTAPLLGPVAVGVGYLLVGVGGGAAGTTVLAFLAIRTAPARRAEAASLTWIMMISGIIISSIAASIALETFSLGRLVAVAAVICAVAWMVAFAAVAGLDDRRPSERRLAAKTPFFEALGEVWREPDARLFTLFVFVSMIAYNFQELIFEPFGGHAFGLGVHETARLTALHQGGVLAGMIGVPALGRLRGGWTGAALKQITIFGCVASAASLGALAVGGLVGPGFPIHAAAFALGLANGVFAVAAIGSMMALAGVGAEGREGVRMGLWGAAQGLAFGVGGVLGAVCLDIVTALVGHRVAAYPPVFALEAAVFLAAALIAARVRTREAVAAGPSGRAGTPALAEPI